MVIVHFGEILRKLRTEKGLTQHQLAVRLGITKSQISCYEQQLRQPSLKVLLKTADEFHVTTDYLLDVEKKHIIDVSDIPEEDLRVVTEMLELIRRKTCKS